MAGRFSTSTTITGPAIGAFAVTPGASALSEPIRMVTIGGAGVVAFTSSVDGADYTTGTLPAGNYPLQATHILGATTATDITGWI